MIAVAVISTVAYNRKRYSQNITVKGKLQKLKMIRTKKPDVDKVYKKIFVVH